MRASSFILPLAMAFAANAFDLSFGPDTVCGSNSVNCNNGFCCSEGNTCDTSGTITKCSNGNPASPFDLGNIGSAVKSQIASAADNWGGQLSSLAHQLPSSIAKDWSSILSEGHVPTDAAGVSSVIGALPTEARGAASSIFADVNSILGIETSATSNGVQKTGSAEGSAPRLGASSFGNTAALVGMIWGAGAIGGAMLVL